MIVEYIKGTIFVLVYITFLYLLGTALFKQKSAPFKVMAGYIVNTVSLALPGIAIQMFQWPWKYYLYIVIGVDIISLVIALVKCHKDKYVLNKKKIFEFIKNYWVLLLVILILTCLMAFYTYDYWHNCFDDDAYYLVKMANLPYLKDPFNINYDTGFRVKISMFDIRNFNTHELEASVYMYLLQMVPPLFARGFLALINKIIVVCSIYSFMEVITKYLGLSMKKSHIQWGCVVASLIYFDFNALAIHKNIYLRDGWIINNAMHFGSAIVLICSFMWLATIFFSQESYIKKFFYFILACIVLVSKSGIALPMIVASFIAYILVELFKKNRIAFFIGCLIVLTASLVIKDQGSLFLSRFYSSDGGFDYLKNLLSSKIIVLVPTTILGYYLFVKYRNNYLALYMVVMAILFIVHPFNNITELASQYSFVFGRAIASFVIFCFVVSGLLIISSLLAKDKKIYFIKKVVIGICALSILGGSLYLREGSLNNMKNEVQLYLENPYFVPNFVMDLGKRLNNLDQKEKKTINALLPRQVYDSQKISTQMFYNGKASGMTIRVAGVVKNFAPHIVSVHGFIRSPRMVQDTLSPFNGYTKNHYESYMSFIEDSTAKENIKNFENTLNKFKAINCIVTMDLRGEKFLKSKGYKLVDQTHPSKFAQFYIFYRQ